MKLDYKKLWILFIEKNIKKIQFRELCNLSPTTLTKLNKRKTVSQEVILCICNALECGIGDIVEIERKK